MTGVVVSELVTSITVIGIGIVDDPDVTVDTLLPCGIDVMEAGYVGDPAATGVEEGPASDVDVPAAAWLLLELGDTGSPEDVDAAGGIPDEAGLEDWDVSGGTPVEAGLEDWEVAGGIPVEAGLVGEVAGGVVDDGPPGKALPLVGATAGLFPG